MVKTYEKKVEKPWKAVVVPCSLLGGGELTHMYLCGQLYLTTSFSFLPLSNPKQQLASPCLGTHAQKLCLWNRSRMESRIECSIESHKNSGVHSWMAEELVFYFSGAQEPWPNSGLFFMGAPPAFLRFEFDLHCFWTLVSALLWTCQSFLLWCSVLSVLCLGFHRFP